MISQISHPSSQTPTGCQNQPPCLDIRPPRTTQADGFVGKVGTKSVQSPSKSNQQSLNMPKYQWNEEQKSKYVQNSLLYPPITKRHLSIRSAALLPTQVQNTSSPPVSESHPLTSDTEREMSKLAVSVAQLVDTLNKTKLYSFIIFF